MIQPRTPITHALELAAAIRELESAHARLRTVPGVRRAANLTSQALHQARSALTTKYNVLPTKENPQ